MATATITPSRIRLCSSVAVVLAGLQKLFYVATTSRIVLWFVNLELFGSNYRDMSAALGSTHFFAVAEGAKILKT
jgi:hypothetical protein